MASQNVKLHSFLIFRFHRVGTHVVDLIFKLTFLLFFLIATKNGVNRTN